MTTRQTYTYAILEISEAAYLEIKAKLERAGYQDQRYVYEDALGRPFIDMNGIAVAAVSTATNDDPSV